MNRHWLVEGHGRAVRRAAKISCVVAVDRPFGRKIIGIEGPTSRGGEREALGLTRIHPLIAYAASEESEGFKVRFDCGEPHLHHAQTPELRVQAMKIRELNTALRVALQLLTVDTGEALRSKIQFVFHFAGRAARSPVSAERRRSGD